MLLLRKLYNKSHINFVSYNFNRKEVTEVDFQLPSSSHTYTYIPPVEVKREEPEVPARRFKEKTVTSLDASANEFVSSSFKKRTIGNAKRNVRQRTDDD